MAEKVIERSLAACAEKALREGYARAVDEHRRAGVPLAMWREGSACEVDAGMVEYTHGDVEEGDPVR